MVSLGGAVCIHQEGNTWIQHDLHVHTLTYCWVCVEPYCPHMIYIELCESYLTIRMGHDVDNQTCDVAPHR